MIEYILPFLENYFKFTAISVPLKWDELNN